MFKLLFVYAFAITSLVGLLLVSNSDLAFPQAELARSSMTIHTADGPVHLRPEIATTPLEQQVGMMGRLDLTDEDAMLFPKARPEKASFWMKNTPSSLDLIFVSPDMTVESIAFSSLPFSEAPIESKGPVIAVLEVPAGLAAEFGIHVGDQVDSKDLRARPEIVDNMPK